MKINLDKFIITRDGKYIGWKQSEFEQALNEYAYSQYDLYRKRLLKEGLISSKFSDTCPCGCHTSPLSSEQMIETGCDVCAEINHKV